MVQDQPKGNVLLIEDSPVVAWAIKKALGRTGYNVVEANPDVSRGELFKLTKIIRQHQIRIIVLDLSLPGLSGEDIATLLGRQLEQCRIIIYSSASSERAEQASQALNVFGYVQKHHKMDALLSMVDRAFSEDLDIDPGTIDGQKTVLVVDDDPDEQLFFEALLRDRQEIRTVFSDTGWIHRLVELENPDLILVDFELGGILNGADVTKSLKQAGLASGIPMLIYSSKDSETLGKMVADSGADGILPKATPPAEVRNVLFRHLELSS